MSFREAMQRRPRHAGLLTTRFVDAGVSRLDEMTCEVTVCTSSLALDDDIWVMEGVDLSRYQAHPVVLRDHDMTQPVARASALKVTPQRITATATFAPIGVSPIADETRGLVKAGFITGVSAGILALESEPLDRRNPLGGQRITRSILLEFSFVSVPSDVASGVTERAAILGRSFGQGAGGARPAGAVGDICAARKSAVTPPIGGSFERAK